MAHAIHFSNGKVESERLAEYMFTAADFALSRMAKERFDELLKEFPWDYLRRIMEECTARLCLHLELRVIPWFLQPVGVKRDFEKYAEFTENCDVVIEDAAQFDKKILAMAGTYLKGYDHYFKDRADTLKNVANFKYDPVIVDRLRGIFTECLDYLEKAYQKSLSDIEEAIKQNGFVLPMLGAAHYLFNYLIEFCTVWRDVYLPQYDQKMQALDANASAKAAASTATAAAAARNAGATLVR